MTRTWKLLVALPVVALLAGCMGTAGSTDTSLEATLDQDIDGDGTIPQGGVEVGAPG
ncbi:hypothetical protein [Jannaschia sp. W003]|uniref:hypothetical protein n=1 Tax=Jannaschia sp. W003 TaxID=2867012 RepID=UPI0021A46A8D|nr:hypothetical protein [Jannaschia sp. W003]UWQ21672.1 hypothetical protein K3554_01180 [Jannaschia sp. W003]